MNAPTIEVPPKNSVTDDELLTSLQEVRPILADHPKLSRLLNNIVNRLLETNSYPADVFGNSQ